MSSTYQFILASSLSLLLFGACQHEEVEDNERYINSDLPITLQAGISAPIEARAALSEFNKTPLQILYGKYSKNYTENWPATATSTNITFAPRRFYPFQNEMIYLRGFHPKPQEEQVPTPNNVYTYDLSAGEHDIILSNEVHGAYLSPASTMKFEHLLSQIQFSFGNDESFPTFRKITKIMLYGACNKAQLNVATGDLSFSGDKEITMYENSTGFAPPIHSQASPGNPIMFQPGVKLTTKFFFSDGKDDITANLNFNLIKDHGDVPVAGYSYTVRFTLTAVGATPLFTISPWKESSSSGIGGVVW